MPKAKRIIFNKNGMWVDFSDIPMINGNNYWIGSPGRILKMGNKAGIRVSLLIEKYENRKVYVMYGDKGYSFNIGKLTKADVEYTYNEITYGKFKYYIGQEITSTIAYCKISKQRINKIKITDRFKANRHRKYKYICLDCGYEGEIWERQLLKGSGCPCCRGRVFVPGKNDMHTKAIKDPEIMAIVNQLYDPEDAMRYSCGMENEVYWVCPDCGYVFKRKISSVFLCGFKCKFCGGGRSFGERVMVSILSQLGYSDYDIRKAMPWSKKLVDGEGRIKIYDIIIYMDYNRTVIMEVFGLQHYEDVSVWTGSSLEEVQANDKYKRQIALKIGKVKANDYIVVDARLSSLEYIRIRLEQNNNFVRFLNGRSINWDLVKIDSTKSEKAKAINMFKSGMDISTIAKDIKCAPTTILRWVKVLPEYQTSLERIKQLREDINNGLSNDEIKAKYGIKAGTVRYHRRKLRSNYKNN